MSAAFQLRLSVDRLGPSSASLRQLPATNRVLYVREGELLVTDAGGERTIVANQAWHGAGACSVKAGPMGATVLRYELVLAGTPSMWAGDIGLTADPLLDHPIDMDPGAAHLMRCDRVDFEPGGIALPHGHRGGGIRCLIEGTLEVTVGEGQARLMRPGDAWFESGREPVLAVASKDEPTSFVRCAILPREIRGKSSIWYVDEQDAQRSRPRTYTVFVDEPIELPGR